MSERIERYALVVQLSRFGHVRVAPYWDGL